MDTPDIITEKLNTYKDKFYSMLDDFSNSFINYKLYPGYSENENIYSTNKSNLESIQANIFIATNNANQNIENLHEYIDDLHKKLTKEKNKHSILQKKMHQTGSSSDGSGLLIDETNDLYKLQRITNIGMVIGILATLLLLFKVFSNPKQNTV